MATCIPYAFGVPGLGGPPNWWDNTVPAGQYRPVIEDPRWRGASARGFGIGTSEEATFRAIYHPSGGPAGSTKSLYFSWHVKYDMGPAPSQDTLYVGLARGSADPNPLILAIVVYNDATDKTADPPGSITALRGTLDAGGT